MAKPEEKKMVHRAFTVITREGEDPFWLEIGASFEHKDHKGLTIALQALPIDGRIVLRLVGSGPREKSDRRPDREDDPPRREEVPEEPTNWREPLPRTYRKPGQKTR